MKIFNKHHTTASPVSAGSIALGEIPLGTTLHKTYIVCKDAGVPLTVDQMKAEIEYVTMKAGAREIVNQISAADLLEFEEYLGGTNTDGFIPIFHALPNLGQRSGENRENLLDKELLAIGTVDAKQITVHVKVASGATLCDQITVRGDVSEDGRKFGSFISYKKDSRSHATISTEQIDALPTGNGRNAYLFIKFSKATFTQLNMKVNGRDLFEDMDKSLLQYLNTQAGRSLVSSKFHLDFLRENTLRLGDMLPQGGVNEFRIDVAWSTAPTSYELMLVQMEDIGLQ